MAEVIPRWITRSELARDLSVSVETVDALVAKGKLPKPVYLTPRLPRFDRMAVNAKLSGNRKLDASTLWDEAMNGKVTQTRSARPKATRGQQL